MTDNPTLKRFVDAQSGEVYERALQEIRNSVKEAKEGKTFPIDSLWEQL